MPRKMTVDIGGDTIPIPLTGKNPPPGWNLETPGADGGFWRNKKKNMIVIASIAVELDGHRWLHMSITSKNRIPTYEELTFMKKHWAGDVRKCIMVFPSTTEHVNIHPRCLHLWCCIDSDPLPDFTQGMGTI